MKAESDHQNTLRSNMKLSLCDDFDKVYVEYFARLVRFAESYVMSHEDAENIVQDMFAMLWSKRMSLHIKTDLTFYLISLVKYRCIDFLRIMVTSQKNLDAYALSLQALETLDDEMFRPENLMDAVRNAIDSLPPRCREVFVKSKFEGKKYKEIAMEMGLSVSTVPFRSRCRQRHRAQENTQ